MDFNPDEYLEKAKQAPIGDFDPDAYLSKESEQKYSPGMTALEHYGQAATLGYLPHIQAATEKGVNALYDLLTGESEKLKEMGVKLPEEKSYVQLRDENIRRLKEEAEANPKAALSGSVGGLVGGGLISSAAMPLKGATTLERVASAGKSGAVLGGIANPGDIAGEVNIAQLEERLKNSGFGGITGALAQGLIEKIPALRDWFKEKANIRAAKATGVDKREVRKLLDKGRLQKYGEDVLESGILKGGPSIDEIGERALQRSSRVGEELGQYIDDLSEKATQKATGGMPAAPGQGVSVGVDRKGIANSLREELLASTNVPGVSSENNQFLELIDEFEKGSNGLIGIKDAQSLKEEIGKRIKWDRLPGSDVPLKEQFYRSLYNKIKTGIEDAAQAVASSEGDDALEKYKALKSMYGTMSDVGRIAEKKHAGEIANRVISPSDYLTGGIGAAAGFASGDNLESRLKNTAIGASLGLANNLGRRFGNPMMAYFNQGMSQKFGRLGDFLNKNPAMAPQLASRIGFQPKFMDENTHLSDEQKKNQYLEGN